MCCSLGQASKLWVLAKLLIPTFSTSVTCSTRAESVVRKCKCNQTVILCFTCAQLGNVRVRREHCKYA